MAPRGADKLISWLHVSNEDSIRIFQLILLVLTLAGCAEPVARHDNPPPTVAAVAPVELRLLTYNVFLRPRPVSFGDDTACRAARIGKLLAGGDADVVALTETFRAADVLTLSATAGSRFPYQALSQPPGTGVLEIPGGLSILSRWPIESTRAITYSACHGPVSDCVAAKGALWAVIRTSRSTRLNVVATHLDAGSWDGDRHARGKQLAELRSLIDQIDPATGPVVVMGDFNIDSLGDDTEYSELLTSLNVKGYEVTPSSTLNCKMTTDCDEPAEPKRLDYIFASGHLRRLATEHLTFEDSACDARYLSDHRAVRTTFRAEP